jgi:hypothetical protein
MPMVFWPPSVSALKANVARYFSGSRAAIVEADAVERFAFTFAGAVFVLAAMFVFVVVSVRWHALPTSSRAVNKQIDVGAFKASSFMDVISEKKSTGLCYR